MLVTPGSRVKTGCKKTAYSVRFMVSLFTIFINGCHTIFCLAMFSKKFMLPYYQALKNMLFWEVTAFSVILNFSKLQGGHL